MRGQQRDRETAFARQVAMHMNPAADESVARRDRQGIRRPRPHDRHLHASPHQGADEEGRLISEVIRDITANINARNV